MGSLQQPHKFTSFSLSLALIFKFQNSDSHCISHVQTVNINPSIIRNWEPYTTKRIKFLSPDNRSMGRCYQAHYTRTPEYIILEMTVDYAISVDAEFKGVFEGFNILPEWKERQIKEGLR
jgi:hypothetical protein